RELRNAGRRPIEFGTRARDRGLALLRRGAHGARSPYRGVSLTFHEVNMRSPFCEVAVLLLAGGLAAQDPGANAAREEYAALMADLKAAQKAFQERLKALQATEEFQQAQKARDTGKLRALLDGIEQLDLQSFTGRFE